MFSAFFPNIWPLAGPNIEKRKGSLQKMARGDRQTHFGTFNFWVKLFLYDSLYKRPPKSNFFSFFHDFCLIFWVPREAALAADLITAWKPIQGGCASSRLFHGFPRPDDGYGLGYDPLPNPLQSLCHERLCHERQPTWLVIIEKRIELE